MKVLGAVVKNDLMSYVTTASLDTWKEILAICASYADMTEFPNLCGMNVYELWVFVLNCL